MRTALLGYLLVIAACSGSSSGSGDHPDGALGDDGGGGGDDGGGDDTGPCTDGAQRCGSAMNVQTCAGDTWTTTDVCALGCTAGVCATTTTCSPGARACFGGEVGVCNSTGTGWLYETSCSGTCAAGACAGGCIPGARRCNASAVETCNAAGTAWDSTETCATACDSGQCALDMLDITTDTNLTGVVIVHGPVNVFSGATLRGGSGDLTIRATSITVDAGGAISVDPAGRGTDGRGGAAATCYSQGVNSSSSGGGGGHATTGGQGRTIGYTCGGFGGSPFGAANDLSVAMGGPGGAAYAQPGLFASGGGTLRLYAPTITISGTLSADGAAASGTGSQSDGGGGAGGSILVAADHLTVSGTISAVGGGATGAGGSGFVKLLYGTATLTGATIRGTSAPSVAPPLAASSLSHPDQTLFYNDDFAAAGLAWPAPFASRQGYYWKVDTTKVAPPTPGTGTLATGEAISIPADKLPAGDNYIHLVSIDAATTIGTTEGTFVLHVNATPPALTSQTHPSQTAWSTNHDPLIAWTLPHGDANYQGVYYVLDHYGDTRPGTADTFVPVSQHQVLHAGIADGIWALHVIAIDTAGRRTKIAAHYQLRVGADPGTGRALGHVTGPSGAVANATVTFNRGMIADQHTNSGGIYDTATVPAGTWEVTASAPGLQSQTKTVTVTASGQITTDFALVP